MRVSVIIPALNEAPSIVQAVCGAQRAGADQVLVADGGSRDETAGLAGDCGAEVVVGPAGRAVQQNAGAARATGDALVFQHADCWLAPFALDQVRRVLGDTTVLAGAFRQQIDAAGLGYRLLERGNAWRVRGLGLPYGDQGIFVRREAFFEVGQFPNVPLMEDLILMRTLRRRRWPSLLPGPIHVSARRWQRYGLIRQTLRNWSLLLRYALGTPPEKLAGCYARHDQPACNG